MGEILKSKHKEPEKKEEKKKFASPLSTDQVEVKLLEEKDIEAALKILRRCAFDATEEEVRSIIAHGLSYGAYVDRILVGVGLSWPASFDEETKSIGAGDAENAVYNEDPAVLLSYEGSGVRRILLRKREEAALERGLGYSITYLSEDVPKGDVSQRIREWATQLEKLYVSEDYELCKTKKGILAYKKLESEAEDKSAESA